MVGECSAGAEAAADGGDEEPVAVGADGQLGGPEVVAGSGGGGAGVAEGLSEGPGDPVDDGGGAVVAAADVGEEPPGARG